jgi:histidinol phosphatase-like enzyme
MNLIQLERHHHYMLQRLKKPIVAILNFYHCFIFRINELRLIVQEAKYC